MTPGNEPGEGAAPLRPVRFIAEPIEVTFNQDPVFEKKPDCPSAFAWRDQTFTVVDVLSEWHDYERKGRMALNMRPEHAESAKRRGSWGVGRHYFRVRVHTGQVFDVYYDRAPKTIHHRKGSWVLFRELEWTTPT